MLTLFRPATGELRAKGVKQTTNAILHPWLKQQITEILAELDTALPRQGPVCVEGDWEAWFERKLLVQLPPIRMILIWDNLAGHKNYELWKWLVAHGVWSMEYGVWSNATVYTARRVMVEHGRVGTEDYRAASIGWAAPTEHPQSAFELIEWLDETAEGWTRHPTPCVWGGKRQEARGKRQAGKAANAEETGWIGSHHCQWLLNCSVTH